MLTGGDGGEEEKVRLGKYVFFFYKISVNQDLQIDMLYQTYQASDLINESFTLL